jgi:ABC-2 type transport system ATP-binding protein
MSTRAAPVLAIRGLRKRYRSATVLHDVALEVGAGEVVAVVGPNGAGKSTLLGCITGDRLPNAGEIRICGHDPFEDPRAAAGCMGFVPEQPWLYAELTVGETLRFVREARGLEPETGERETGRLLRLLALEGAEGALCRELSQGMGRKVAIIAALLHAPRLLVLDEAFNGLDRSSATRLRDELLLRRDAGSAILLSSHDLEFLAEWCDRGLFLSAGAGAVRLEGEGWEEWRRAPSLEPAGPAPRG